MNLSEGIEYIFAAPTGAAKIIQETRGGSNKKTYSLTFRAVKVALIRSYNENKFAKYYLDRVIKQNEEQTNEKIEFI
jgi:hypothetical protein